MDHTVRRFNALSRNKTVPTGTGPNNWHFSVRCVKANYDPRDVVLLVSPANELLHVAAPPKGTPILSLPTPSAQADMVISLLLEAFVKGVLKGSNARHEQFAPRTWSCSDEELAKLLEERLKDLGVRQSLCVVQRGSKEENDSFDEIWDLMKEEIVNGFEGYY